MSYKLTVTKVHATGEPDEFPQVYKWYQTAANVRRYGRMAVAKAIKDHGEIDQIEAAYALDDIAGYDGESFAVRVRTWNRSGSAGLRIVITQENVR